MFCCSLDGPDGRGSRPCGNTANEPASPDLHSPTLLGSCSPQEIAKGSLRSLPCISMCHGRRVDRPKDTIGVSDATDALACVELTHDSSDPQRFHDERDEEELQLPMAACSKTTRPRNPAERHGKQLELLSETWQPAQLLRQPDPVFATMAPSMQPQLILQEEKEPRPTVAADSNRGIPFHALRVPTNMTDGSADALCLDDDSSTASPLSDGSKDTAGPLPSNLVEEPFDDQLGDSTTAPSAAEQGRQLHNLYISPVEAGRSDAQRARYVDKKAKSLPVPDRSSMSVRPFVPSPIVQPHRSLTTSLIAATRDEERALALERGSSSASSLRFGPQEQPLALERGSSSASSLRFGPPIGRTKNTQHLAEERLEALERGMAVLERGASNISTDPGKLVFERGFTTKSLDLSFGEPIGRTKNTQQLSEERLEALERSMATFERSSSKSLEEGKRDFQRGSTTKSLDLSFGEPIGRTKNTQQLSEDLGFGPPIGRTKNTQQLAEEQAEALER